MKKRRTPKIVAIGLAKPNEHVIAVAEQILEMARAGTLRSLVWAGDNGDHITSGISAGTDIHYVIGFLERMKYHMMSQALERMEVDGD